MKITQEDVLALVKAYLDYFIDVSPKEEVVKVDIWFRHREAGGERAVPGSLTIPSFTPPELADAIRNWLPEALKKVETDAKSQDGRLRMSYSNAVVSYVYYNDYSGLHVKILVPTERAESDLKFAIGRTMSEVIYIASKYIYDKLRQQEVQSIVSDRSSNLWPLLALAGIGTFILLNKKK